MQMAVYAGFPRAIQALDAAKEAFDQIDEAVELATDPELAAEELRQRDA
jgi:pyruvate/2-oxoacid:ferredoxin oxidoreductase alpha subunit